MSANRLVSRADVAVLALLLVYCLMGMAPFAYRMATLHDDDGPIHYARVFNAPADYAGDVMIGVPTDVVLPSRILPSAMIWIPALLQRYAAIDPYPVTWVLTFAQALLIGIGVAALSVVMTGRRSIGAIAAMYALVAAPWVWAPANFGNDLSWNFVPYPANLALGPALLAIAALLRGAPLLVACGLIAAALIHPLMALYAVAVVTIYWTIEWCQDRRNPAARLAVIAAVAAAALGPGLMATATLPDPLPPATVLAGLKLNAHIWPWGVDSWWAGSAQAACAALLLAWWAWRNAAIPAPVRRLWFATLAGVGVCAALHVAGALLGIPSLLILVGLRAWLLIALLSLPIVLEALVLAFEQGKAVAAIAAGLLLVLPFISGSFALPLLLIAALIASGAPRVAGSSGRGALTAGAVAAWAVLVAIAPAGVVRDESWVGRAWRALNGAAPHIDVRVAAALMAAIAGLWLLRRAGLGSRGVLVAVYAAWFLAAQAWIVAAAMRPDSSDAAALDVQLWARAHTPRGTRFIILRDGWRTMAHRPAMVPFTRESFAYVAPRAAEEWRLRLLSAYGVDAADAARDRGTPLLRREIAQFRRFDETGLLRFSADLGATHAVIPTCYAETERTQFDLPLLFENRCFRVYDVSGPAGHVRRRDIAAPGAMPDGRPTR